MKEHIVREQFSLDGQDYPRGSRLTDPVLLEAATRKFPHHIVRRHLDAAVPATEPATKAQAKSA